jgi:hypothetical protein
MQTFTMRIITTLLLSFLCTPLMQRASAAPIVLDFEGLPSMPLFPVGAPVPANAQLSNQFLATSGVSFSSGSPYVAVVELGLGHATSGVNGISGTTGSGLSTFERSFPIVATFFNPKDASTPATTDFVSVRIDMLGDSGLSVTLNAFDIHGILIDSFTTPDIGGTALQVSHPGIHSVQYLGTHDSGGTGLDDFTFNPVISVPEPETWVALGLGVVVIALTRRRPKQACP